jgi:hypothetical protein
MSGAVKLSRFHVHNEEKHTNSESLVNYVTSAPSFHSNYRGNKPVSTHGLAYHAISIKAALQYCEINRSKTGERKKKGRNNTSLAHARTPG